jgi:TctA family transporter
VPGINGRKGIILSLPLLVALDPLTAAVYLVAMHAVVHTCGTLPAVLIGVPTSTSEAAVVLDGYPLVKQGRAWEAIAATIASSAAGGLVGAVALIAFIPFGLLLVPYIGSAEIMGLTLLGLLAAAVGFDGLTGTDRFTFGQLTLAPGLNIAAVLAGLFVIPEMLTMAKRPEIERRPVPGTSIIEIVKGMTIVFKHIGVVIRSSIIGIVVGFIPGIGSSVAVWMAYGHAVQTEPHDPPFGQGNVAGVLAAEAANNSKEGGSFAPTLMFAVPGTSGMAIMMLAFTYIGIDVGPRLVAQDPGFISLVGWVILIANLIAIPVCLAFVPTFGFIATLKQQAIMPVAMILSVVAAVVVLPHASSLLQIAVFSTLGVALKFAGWPRPPMLLGFVIGPILESTLSRTVTVYGWSALERPGLIVLLTLALTVLAITAWRSRKRRKIEGYEPISPAPLLAALLATLFALAWYGATVFPPSAQFFPIGAAIVGIACCHRSDAGCQTSKWPRLVEVAQARRRRPLPDDRAGGRGAARRAPDGRIRLCAHRANLVGEDGVAQRRHHKCGIGCYRLRPGPGYYRPRQTVRLALAVDDAAIAFATVSVLSSDSARQRDGVPA